MQIGERGADVNSKQCLFSLLFDNVNKHYHAKETSTDKQNTMKNMVQAYAAMDRIPSISLDDSPIAMFNISLFLPNENETDMIR